MPELEGNDASAVLMLGVHMERWKIDTQNMGMTQLSISLIEWLLIFMLAFQVLATVLTECICQKECGSTYGVRIGQGLPCPLLKKSPNVSKTWFLTCPMT